MYIKRSDAVSLVNELHRTFIPLEAAVRADPSSSRVGRRFQTVYLDPVKTMTLNSSRPYSGCCDWSNAKGPHVEDPGHRTGLTTELS